MATLSNPKGITSRSVIDVPDQWNAEWFRRFIRTQLAQADARNATAGTGISITGNSITPATIAVTTDIQALFHQPYVLATAPSGISGTFNAYRTLASQAGVVTVTDGGAEGAITVGIAVNGIGNTQLRHGSALSVIGNSTNIAANVADIASTANGDVLWNNGGNSIGFGPLTFLGTVTTGIWNGTTIAAPAGGTGQNTYAVGDLLYASAANALSRLADVASGSFLRSGGVGVAPGWSATSYPNSATAGDILFASGANTYGNLSDVAAGSYLRSGGVGAAPIWSTLALPNAAALGDIVYASAANTYTDLAGNITTAKMFLTQTGTGSVSAAPGWNSIASTDLPGSFSGFANPSGKVGPSAANGTATTAMRSDAGPAIDLTATYPWTGSHTFANAITVNKIGSAFNGAQGTSGGGLAVVNNSAAATNNISQIKLTVPNSFSGAESAAIAAISENGGNQTVGVGLYTTPAGGGLAQRVYVGSAGNVTINAPASGDAATVSNVAGANALVVTGNAAGTAVVRFNTQATTGGQTATFTATNKPGVASGSPQKWLPVNADGTTYYVPLFS